MRFKITLTRGARVEIRAILDYLVLRSSTGAAAWDRRWHEATLAIQARADKYGEAPESEHYPEIIRQALFKTRRGLYYRILFVIRALDVYLLHVRGPGQDIVGPHDINQIH